LKEYKILDIHTHTYPEAIAAKATKNLGEFYNFDVSGKGTHADLEEQAREGGVNGFVLFCVATNAHQVQKVNDSVASLCKLSVEHGFECVGLAGMHQNYPDFESEIIRCKSMGLKGVKIHPDIQAVDTDDKKMLELYELLEANDMCLLLHAGDDRKEYRFSEPKKIRRVADMFPRLRIVAAHFGGYKAWDEAEEYLYGVDNMWYDCSSALWAMTPEKAAELTSKCGYDRMMFGTDYPVYSLKNYIDLFMKVPLTEKQREDIFYNNAKEFFFS